MPRIPGTRRARGFTLIELMVAIGILMVLGVMIIGFLRGALTMNRTGTARGKAYEAAQTTLRMLQDDLEQVIAKPPHAHGPQGDLSFSIQQDPWGRQMLCFMRAWGEEQSSLAGYDSGRAAPGQRIGSGGPGRTWSSDFQGRNVEDTMRASRGNLEVVWMMEPVGASLRLYRAERSPPQANGGLIDSMLNWAARYRPNNPRLAVGYDDPVPGAFLREYGLGTPARAASPANPAIWSQFDLVAENVVCLGIECWDDWQGRTTTWLSGRDGPVTSWALGQRLNAGQYPLPSAIRITLIVAADDPIRAESPLVGEANRGDTSLFLDGTDNFPDVTSPLAFVRVNGEMMGFAGKSSTTIGSLARGALGTREVDHPKGSVAVAGIGFQRIIQFPVSR
ncbi:MAG: prepilin-type N-terminal cleavage/methylation domain-containing protein [Planctomycetes bacterium]|nr:prepilin-type N-terminal cleavage/methylation domain-containing protein [Planctomycetota bacterium]